MIRPLVIIAGDFPFPSGSAASSRLRNLAAGFAALGNQVLVGAYGNRGDVEAPVAITPSIQCAPAPGAPHPFRNTGLRSKFMWFQARRRARRAAENLIITAANNSKPLLLLLYGRAMSDHATLIRWARARGIPVVLDHVEANCSFVGLGGMLSPIYWDWVLGARLLPRKVDAMSVISRALGAAARTRGCRRIQLVPSAEDFSAPPPQHPVPTGVFRIAYVGALLPRDNPAFVATLAERLVSTGGVILEILGRYESVPEAAPYVDRLRALEGTGAVILRGSPDDATLTSTMAKVDALLIPRRDSPAEVAAFPTRLAESLRTARPVFVSAVGDIPYHIRDGVDAVLLNPSDVASAVEKILVVARSPDRGLALGRAGYLCGRERFDRMKHAAALLELAGEIRR